MGSTADKTKGRVKEAAGDLTGDRSLERDGKVDRASGEVKEVVDKAKAAVDDVVDRAKDALHRH